MAPVSPSNPIALRNFGQSSALLSINCLRFVIALQCFGIAGRYLLSSLESESHLFEYLLFERGVSETISQRVDDVGAYLCLAAGVCFSFNLLLSPMFRRLQRNDQPNQPTGAYLNWLVLSWGEVCAAAFVAAWSIANALAHGVRGGIYSELAIGEVAVRFGCPIALVLLLLSQSEQDSGRRKYFIHLAVVARWVLTIVIATTFLVHGFKAIQLFGPFVDLILLTDMRLFQLNLEQATAETALQVIGWIDVLLAIGLLFTRYKVIAIYMLVWGLITSLSRVTAFGAVAWPETVVRAANWGAVLVLLTMWRREAVELDDVDAS